MEGPHRVVQFRCWCIVRRNTLPYSNAAIVPKTVHLVHPFVQNLYNSNVAI